MWVFLSKAFCNLPSCTNCQNKSNSPREKNPREWLPLFSPPSPKDKSWWQNLFLWGLRTNFSFLAILVRLSCQYSPLESSGAQVTMCVGGLGGVRGDTISCLIPSFACYTLQRVLMLNNIDYIRSLCSLSEYWSCFKHNQDNLCKTKLSSERPVGCSEKHKGGAEGGGREL